MEEERSKHDVSFFDRPEGRAVSAERRGLVKEVAQVGGHAPSEKVTALDLERVLAAYDELDHGAKLHLGYAYRHRGATGAVIFVQQHGHKREVRAFIALLEEVGLPVPEGF
jgi:D-alanine-D-alanine ligase-like ATP-grasp enzyme